MNFGVKKFIIKNTLQAWRLNIIIPLFHGMINYNFGGFIVQQGILKILQLLP